MLKILQARLQQYVNQEFLEKAEEPENKLQTSSGSQKKQQNSRKTSTSASLSTLKSLTVWITTNWTSLQEMGIPDHFTCLLRNLYVGQEAIVRTFHEQWTGSNLGKEKDKAVYCHLVYITYMWSTPSEMPAWMNHKQESRSRTSDMQMSQ